MTGKAYTMKEMKAIVNYLVEHKAYSDIRGRKMWMDFASSKETTRTWQSLKETFLKRILPDIHNPYYNLSLMEVASFKQGLDIGSKLENKLDLEPVNEKPIPGTSKENGHNDDQEEDGVTKENKKDDNEQPGEDAKIVEKLNNIRDSTETLVLEPCYQTAEDIQKDLENDSEKNQSDIEKDDPKESDTLHQDSTSDCENIDKINNAIKETSEKNKETDVPNKISETEEKPAETNNITNEISTKESENKDDSDNNPKNTSSSILSPNDANESRKPNEDKENHDKSKNITQNSSTIDTQLPNNPEELKQSKKGDFSETINKSSLNDQKRNNRAMSADVPTKRKKIKQKSVSDTEAGKNCRLQKQIKVTNCEAGLNKIAEASEDLNIDVDKITNSENLNDANQEKPIEDNQSAQGVSNNEALEANSNSPCAQIQVTPETENPCLKSVNLYEEQFSCTIYSDSDDEQKVKGKNEPQKKQDYIPMQTATEKVQVINSSSTDVPQKSALKIAEKKLRENALSRALGFTSNFSRNRKRSLSYNKRRSSSHKKLEILSDSSSSSYETESIFQSPPRGNNKRNRKYMKPESHRIMSLGEEGTLFVMNGKKIYPVIKNGRSLKTYITYSSDGQSDNEESYWKLKYVEEKKKAAELAKQLENFTKAKESSLVPPPMTDIVPKEIQKPQVVDETCQKSIPQSKTTDASEQSIKIKITNNEKEVQVEGPWSCINPVLEQVVQMMKGTENSPAVKPVQPRGSSSDIVAISGMSSPAETSAKRVAEMEKEIFKEIEEIEKAEQENPELQEEGENNAEYARRNTRKRIVTAKASKVESSPKKARVKVESKTEETELPPKRTRTPRKLQNDTNGTPVAPQITKDKAKTNKRASKKTEVEEQEEILYKFPSPPREISRAKRAPPRPRYTIKTARIYSSPDHLSLHSEETQGYIDTDNSPVICIRKKRKTGVTSRRLSRFRKKSVPSITEDLSSESSLLVAPIQTQTFTNTSLSSHIYRSDSYQLLMPTAKDAPNYLERIEEISMKSHEDPDRNTFEDFDNSNKSKEQCCDLSLPTSPVLSVVENLSVNKSHLSNLDEIDIDEPPEKITLNNLMPLEDVSMPLMESNYEVRRMSGNGNQYHYSLEDRSISDSIVDRVSTVQIDDVSNSISTKLRNLMIESAKKDAAKGKLAARDEPTAVKPTAKAKRTKRSSTPRKRQSKTKSFPDPCIEEHTESCSRAVQQTPIIKITAVESEPSHDTQKKATRRRERIKKDIIKVKLPKLRRRKSDIGAKTTEDDVAVGNDTESGIFLQGINDSVDLIHNHSDTCCKAQECVDASLEIMETTKSIITVESDSGRNNEYNNNVMDKNVALEMINQNAQDGMDLIAARSRSCSEISNSLLTDDLSDEITTPRSSKWFLLSEDENTTTLQNGDGANLNQIFPITYAVPNLSTITEASKDIDEHSRNSNRNLFNF